MSDLDWGLVAEVFADALELPPDERPAFLAARCEGHPGLRTAVERLLTAEGRAGSAFPLRDDSAFPAPDRVGPWRLVREIGRGGMGQVFLAERVDGQFTQQVAVKLLKRGMDSEAILGRFLRERQILAALDHPNIAHLLDGGMAEDGRPYLVMEFVDGLPITHYADDRGLSIDERLHLMREVCLAVEYAHRNLVVHRDLKPSNILVTADGRPKLLDFGIAKLLSHEDDQADPTTLTDAGGRPLTPEYAAPEQFLGGAVTTSTDAYALGAVLYELLTGACPFPERRDAGWRLQGVVDREPALLSAVAAPPDVAAARSTDPVRLRRRLRGDLDTIVSTALRTAPERRFASVEALREDLRRHQERLPVRARPDTPGYRISQFARRHRVGVLATSTIAALLLAFLVTALVQANRIRHQALALEVERDRARREAETSQEVSDFLVGVFEVSDPTVEGLGDSIRARDLLDRGAERVETRLAGQPGLQARMLSVIGRAYDNLRHLDQAEAVIQRALEVQRATGDAGVEVVDLLQQLAGTKARRGDYEGARALIREAVTIQAGLGPDEPGMWTLHADLAAVMHVIGAADSARTTAERGLLLYRQLPAGQVAGSSDDLARLANLFLYVGALAEADSVYTLLAAKEARVGGPRSAAVAAIYNRWAGIRQRQEDPDGADSLLTLALDIHEELGPRSLATARTLGFRAALSLRRGRLERADTLFRRAIDILRERLGDDDRTVAAERARLAETLVRRERTDEAAALYRRVLASYHRAGASAAGFIPTTEYRLALALRAGGRLGASVPPFESALRAFETRFPPDYPVTAQIRRDYGNVLVELGMAHEGSAMLQRALDVLEQRRGPTDPQVDSIRAELARARSAPR